MKLSRRQRTLLEKRREEKTRYEKVLKTSAYRRRLRRFRRAQEALEEGIPSGRELLWEEYKLHMDLYKHYLSIAAAFNVFYYGVTGGVLSYSLNNLARWVLLFPLLTSLLFAKVFWEAYATFRGVEREVELLAAALGVTHRETNILTRILGWSFVMFVVNIILLLFALFFWNQLQPYVKG